MGLLMDANDPEVDRKIGAAVEAAAELGFAGFHQFSVNNDVDILGVES